MNKNIEPFKIEVPEVVLVDLRDRLARTRWPDEVNDENESYGTSLSYLKELCAYWKDTYRWREQEAELNRFPQFLTEIGGLNIHFIHARSREPDALPLIITHGWPGSIVEFMKIIDPLTDPVGHGGEARDAFHVVCPSLPGYGFSDAPGNPGMGPGEIAEIETELMARLGYSRYGAQGGDWGAVVSTFMGALDPEHCIGIHLNLVFADPPGKEEDPTSGLTAREKAYLEENQKFQTEEMGYFHVQSTRPQSLGYALNDSPAGLAAWIVEKFRVWTDCSGHVENKFTKDELLTNIMLYWVTGKITASMRLYFEAAHGNMGAVGVSEVPVGGAIFPKDVVKTPRSWAEKQYNLVHWTEMPSGGHFAALEEPELLTRDIRKFFRLVR
jgi:pimeloyl-ACP methyl ester carboxylesterase